MNRGPMRGDNAQGFSAERQQANVTWGGRGTQRVTAPSGAGTYVFPADPPIPAGVFPIPGLTQFDQLVDMRYERPTTWAVCLFIEASGEMDAGNELRMLWNVFTSVGRASNRLRIETLFTKGAVIPGERSAQSAFVFQQIAAQTIQVIPEFLAIDMNSVNQIQTITWSAWIAPLVH